MQRARHRIRGWLGLAGAIGALILVPTLSGCPGTLDPDVAKLAGTTGAGGTMASDCTGANDGATIVTTTCATQYCHSAQGASGVGGLDLTIDSGIASRLVGVMSSGSPATNGSVCAGATTEPYLEASSSPAKGLLIDKCTTSPPCGARMPYYPLNGKYLTDMQLQCLQQWATMLTSP